MVGEVKLLGKIFINVDYGDISALFSICYYRASVFLHEECLAAFHFLRHIYLSSLMSSVLDLVNLICSIHTIITT
jgi:hypothetical protein